VPDTKGSEGGFTIVELMIATMVFSTIMIIASATIVRFTSMFQRGLTETTTQNAARAIIDDISSQLQTTSLNGFTSVTAAPDGTRGYCVQQVRYNYRLGQLIGVNGVPGGLVKQDQGLPEGCGDAQGIASVRPTDGQELLGQNMRLAQLAIDPDPSNSLFAVRVIVAHGDDDLLCSRFVANSCQEGAAVLTSSQFADTGILSGLQCRAGAGSQYCAVMSLSTTVKRRL
jgi:type II secretory pathway pseudopilin PulG